jgi:hypothetical protein
MAVDAGNKLVLFLIFVKIIGRNPERNFCSVSFPYTVLFPVTVVTEGIRGKYPFVGVDVGESVAIQADQGFCFGIL